MFADTIALTLTGIGSVTVVRINQDNYGSEYRFADTTHVVSMKIRNSKVADKNDGRTYDRHNVEITRTVLATSTVPQYRQKAYLVWEVLPTDAVAQATPGALAAWMQSTTPKANLAGLLAFES